MGETTTPLPRPTMFKLEEKTLAELEAEDIPRKVSCVSCGKLLSMAAYAMGATSLDKKCPYCGMTAEKYWKNKPHWFPVSGDL